MEGAGISELEVANMAGPSTNYVPPLIHIEKVQKLSDITSEENFKIAKMSNPTSIAKKKHLPRPLRHLPNLKGRDMICFQGDNILTTQYIDKEITDIQNISPAYFYIKYYAYVEGHLGRRGAKCVYVRPAVEHNVGDTGAKLKALPITGDFEWVEQIVELDMVTAKERGSHYNGFEFGVMDFDTRDYWLIDRFAILQGVQNPTMEIFHNEFDPIPVAEFVNENEQLLPDPDEPAPTRRARVRKWISRTVFRPIASGWRRAVRCFKKGDNPTHYHTL